METLTTDEVLVADKSNSHCGGCGKKIEKGEPRLKRMRTTKYGYQASYICYRCSDRILNEEKKQLEERISQNKMLKKTLVKKMKECSKVLITNTLMENVGDKNGQTKNIVNDIY